LITGMNFYSVNYPTSDMTVGASGDFKAKMRFARQHYYDVKLKFTALVSDSARGLPGKCLASK